MSNRYYNHDFYKSQMHDSRESAKKVIPLLMELYRPQSVVDVGCGTGVWLAEFMELGIEDVCGVDGNYVDRTLLQIPPDRFFTADLRTFRYENLGREFDLAISLEVAEHLSAQYSTVFIRNLTKLSKVILFSAALPYQGGVEHKNENWLEYWISLFKQFDFYPVDYFRRKIWYDTDICWWYRQNIVLFVDQTKLVELFPYHDRGIDVHSYVHPELFLWACARGLLGHDDTLYSRDVQNYRLIIDAYLKNEPVNADKLAVYANRYTTKLTQIKCLEKARKIILNFLRVIRLPRL